MATLSELIVRVGVDADEVDQGIGQVTDRVDRGLAAVTAAGVAAGAGLESFARSQADTNAVLARTASATGETEEALRSTALAIGEQTGSAADAAAGMEQLIQRGIDTREGFEEIIPVANDLADATGQDLAGSIDAADKLLAPFGEDLNDLGANADQMARLIAQTDVPLGTMERNLGRVPDELQALGFGLDEAAAGIEVFRDRGFTGQEAVREFRRAVEDSEGDMAQFQETLGLSAGEWDNYLDAASPAAGQMDELAAATGDQDTVLQGLQDRLDNLMVRFGGFADVASALALPLMALGPVVGGVRTAISTVGPAIMTNAIRPMARWAATAAATAARVVASTAMIIASTIRAAAVTVAQIAVQIGRWVVLGTQSLIQAARVAAAWLIAMGPIGIVIAAVVGLVALIIANWDTIRDATVAAFDAVVGAVTSAFNWIVDFASGMIDAFVGTIQNGIDTIVTFFTDLPGNIMSALGNVGSLLTDAGRNLLQGLIDGIQAMAGRVMDTVSNIAGRVRDLLPFSPAKEGPLRQNPMDEAGSNLMTMLGDGIADSAPDVLDQVRELAGQITDPLEMNGTVRTGAAGPSHRDNARIQIDDNEAGRFLATLLQRTARTNGVDIVVGSGVR